MGKDTIQLSKDYSIPANSYATQGNAILGIRDSGKTYTATKAAEELMDAGIPIIVFDPIGIWKNLKIGTGKHKGYPVVVAGGEGSDIRLTVNNATDIVRAAMKEGVNLVIDLYSPELINKSTWIKVVQETIDLLMYENKSYGIRHIFLEEAAEFIPQRLQPQHARVYASIERLARMGRNAMLGMTIINQRAEEVNKAILEIMTLCLLHKQVGKNSLTSIKKWLDIRGYEKKADVVMNNLPKLKQGQCYVISDDHPHLIQVTAKNTFHPDPKADPGKVKLIGQLAMDVSPFIEKMNRQLKKEPAEKKSEQVKKVTGPDHSDMKAEVNALKQEIKEKDSQIVFWKTAFDELVQAAEKHHSFMLGIISKVQNGKATVVVKKSIISHSNGQALQRPVSTNNGMSSVTSGAMRMLKAAGMYHPKPISKFKMAALARLSHSSGTFSTHLSTLKREGLLNAQGSDFTITAEGLSRAGEIEPLPTDPKELTELWCGVIGSESGAARMLRALVDSYPEDISKEDLGTEVGMSHTSGSFSTYISTLKRNGLVKVNGNWIKAAEELFN